MRRRARVVRCHAADDGTGRSLGATEGIRASRGVGAQRVTELRVRDGDERLGPLGDGAAAQLGDAVLGDDVVDGVLHRRHRRARGRGATTIRDTDSSRVVECSTTNPIALRWYIAPRAKSACPPLPDQYRPAIISELHWPSRSTSIVALIDTKQRSRPMIARVVDPVDGQELDRGVVVQEVVEPLGAERERGDHLAGRVTLRVPVSAPDSKRSITPSENSSVWRPRSRWSCSRREDRVRDRADAGLDRGAVGDPFGDERGDARGRVSRRRRWRHLDQRVVGLGPAGDLVRCSVFSPNVRGMLRVDLEEERQLPMKRAV